MRIITIEEHYADQRIIDATAKYGDPSYMTALPDKVRGAYNHMRFTGEKLTDVDTVRFHCISFRIFRPISRQRSIPVVARQH